MSWLSDAHIYGDPVHQPCQACSRGFRTVRGVGAHGSLHHVRVEVRTRLAIAAAWATYVTLRWLGEDRAAAVAERACFALARYRVAGGPWLKFRRPRLPRARVVR